MSFEVGDEGYSVSPFRKRDEIIVLGLRTHLCTTIPAKPKPHLTTQIEWFCIEVEVEITRNIQFE